MKVVDPFSVRSFAQLADGGVVETVIFQMEKHVFFNPRGSVFKGAEAFEHVAK